MKKSILFAALTTVALSAPFAIADEAHHPAQDKKAAPAKSAPATSPAAKDAEQQQMNEMRKQVDAMPMQKSTAPDADAKKKQHIHSRDGK